MSRTTFQKRQKEMKRQEKRQMKAEKRAQRKLGKTGDPEAQPEEILQTEGLQTESVPQEPDAPRP